MTLLLVRLCCSGFAAPSGSRIRAVSRIRAISRIRAVSRCRPVSRCRLLKAQLPPGSTPTGLNSHRAQLPPGRLLAADIGLDDGGIALDFGRRSGGDRLAAVEDHDAVAEPHD